MSNILVGIEHINAGYNHNLVLKDINLNIHENDFLGIIGPNGGGKTTLLKVILGLLKPISGKIEWDKSTKNRIGYMPQTNSIDKKFPISVSEVIESGLITDKQYSKVEKKDKVTATLKEMGLEDLHARPIGELSGGQLQRALLGRAIVNDPALLILDEPNSYVDKQFESLFYELLQSINSRTAIILVSHDIGTVVSNVKNIACVNETLHYHDISDVNTDWIEEHWGCPIEIIGHGDIPHRILKKH